MDYDFDNLYQRSHSWARQACDAGWLLAADIEPITAVEQRTPASLFGNRGERPLVVAFFGGTGVGKSSLLNRLAGQPIARAGIERPTSREVSLYLHQAFDITQLPEAFPLEELRLARHQRDEHQPILWIDMPDIDSTEQHNRAIVLDWLPHIDLLIYVVSPERYRDDRGWRLLQSEGSDHAWLFVMNHWDEGEAEQLDDFARQLQQAGFDQPLILRTNCAAPSTADDFDQLEKTIQSLANQHTIQQLELRGRQQRLEQLESALQKAMRRLGSDAGFSQLQQRSEQIWRSSTNQLHQGLAWPIKQLSSSYANQQLSTLPRLLGHNDSSRSKTVSESPSTNSLTSTLWDDWAQSHLNETLDRLVIEADIQAIPPTPLKNALVGLRKQARTTIQNRTEQSLRQALANPGNQLQRFALRGVAITTTLLPLAAIGWIAWQVVNGYYDSAYSDRPYLSTDFAVHSTLLIALAWLLPWSLRQALRPSTEKSAFKGLNSGLTAGLNQLELQIGEAIDSVLQQRTRYLDSGTELIESCRQSQQQSPAADNKLLARLIRQPEEGCTDD